MQISSRKIEKKISTLETSHLHAVNSVFQLNIACINAYTRVINAWPGKSNSRLIKKIWEY